MTTPKFGKEFYEKAWDILSNLAGASSNKWDRSSFAEAFTDLKHEATEWRFQGYLGFGGKFWRRHGFNGLEEFDVSCYKEDRNPTRDAMVNKVNQALKALVEEERKKNPCTITKLSLVTGRQGADSLMLWFDMVEGTWPYTEKATATMSVSHGEGEEYAKRCFPGIPLEVIRVSPTKVTAFEEEEP